MSKADVAELADAHDSKSCGGNTIWVRLPASAPQFLWLDAKPREILSELL